MLIQFSEFLKALPVDQQPPYSFHYWSAQILVRQMVTRDSDFESRISILEEGKFKIMFIVKNRSGKPETKMKRIAHKKRFGLHQKPYDCYFRVSQ